MKKPINIFYLDSQNQSHENTKKKLNSNHYNCSCLVYPLSQTNLQSNRQKRIMTHFVTPEPLDMNFAWNVLEERPPVARQLFTNDDEIEDPPQLVRSQAAVVVPWDEEEDFPDPPVLERQHAGDGTAVVWSSSDEEDEEDKDEDEDMETLSVASENSMDLDAAFEQNCRDCQELAREAEALLGELNELVTQSGLTHELAERVQQVSGMIEWANEIQNRR